MDLKAYGIIMAGGGGTRFWPLSRQANPKQLLNLSGKDLMINETLDRLPPVIPHENIFVVTNMQQATKLIEAIRGRIDEDRVLTEPVSRNTAACIGYAAVEILRRYGDGIMCIFPADHYICDEQEFRRILTMGIEYAKKNDKLVTIGLRPTFPSTGFGYIRYNKIGTSLIKDVLEFVEKPDQITAQHYVENGEYAWNSGMFIWKASVILRKFQELLPDIYDDLMMIHDALRTQKEKSVLARVYPRIRKISIDFGVMEKSSDVVVIPAEFGWNDVGSWDMMHVLHTRDEYGNIILGDAECINTTNAVAYSSGRHISVVDMDDVVVVETADAVLVCRLSKAQDTKLAVERLINKKRNELL